MIVDDKRVATIVDGTITESFFSVKQENLAHIFSILRNSLYSDKASRRLQLRLDVRLQ
jgi:hypothetical protein